jgi:hypothetical protein
LWKFDGQGNGLWNKIIPTTLNTGVRSLFVNSNSQALVSGDFIVNPTQGTGLTFDHAIFFNKYNPDGSTVYERKLLGYNITSYLGLYDATIDNSGNIDMIGYFNGSIKLLGTSGDPVHPWNDFYNSFFIAHFPE